MRIDPASALAEAVARYKLERPALHAVAGLFFFVPALALLFFVENGPPTEGETVTDALRAMLIDNWPWLLGVQLLELFGSVWLYAWLLGHDKPVLGQALRRAVALFPMFLIASVLIGMLTFAGLLFFLAPGFYVIGRTFLVAPVLIAEPGTTAIKAFEESIRRTQGMGWMLFVVAAAIWLTGQFPNLLLRPLEAPLGMAGTVLIDGAAALAGAAVTLLILLVKVVVYRRTAGSKRGT
ncbi:hypothetical protein [Sphingomonas sp. AX6]|uniref:hypothetical protein n=1 Tax=Sphingomonas sp. AX6 TaxID=2653171 RepID=UPI0012F0CC18|nr:hypothetical protein [Sphingomonas sp. AX6]VXC73888.1 conserved membrane hypothetical protein [Sphingomonas sp. AX6]